MIQHKIYYDKNGKEIDLETWVNLCEDRKYTIIKQEKINDYFISTIWLGLNHGLIKGQLLIFETMVFKDDEIVEMERCSTLEEAIEGHEMICKKYSNEPYVLKDWK